MDPPHTILGILTLALSSLHNSVSATYYLRECSNLDRKGVEIFREGSDAGVMRCGAVGLKNVILHTRSAIHITIIKLPTAKDLGQAGNDFIGSRVVTGDWGAHNNYRQLLFLFCRRAGFQGLCPLLLRCGSYVCPIDNLPPVAPIENAGSVCVRIDSYRLVDKQAQLWNTFSPKMTVDFIQGRA